MPESVASHFSTIVDDQLVEYDFNSHCITKSLLLPFFNLIDLNGKGRNKKICQSIDYQGEPLIMINTARGSDILIVRPVYISHNTQVAESR